MLTELIKLVISTIKDPKGVCCKDYDSNFSR